MSNTINSIPESLCSCGKIYGETCTVRAEKCPQFLKYRQEVTDNFMMKQKEIGVKKQLK